MNQAEIDRILLLAIDEDVRTGDVTTEATVAVSRSASGEFRAKSAGVIAGTAVAARVFELLPGTVSMRWSAADGDEVTPGLVVGRIEGSARTILTGERVALNILQRMSGIATATRRLVERTAGTDAVILDTRKTAPGLRVLDKAAVRAGGGANHRFGLFDMVMIKDNHIVASGGISQAIARARRSLNEDSEHDVRIEVEARTLDEVREIVDHHGATGDPDRIMLDNMAKVRDGGVDVSVLTTALQLVDGCMETEASGNVTEATVAAIAATGVDYISSGSITHSAPALDISLELTLSN